MGEHLIESALSNPKVLFVGSEVYVNGVAKVLKQILEKDIKNIRLCGMNFVYLLNILNQNSIDELKIINPDPWHKKRHFKRRLINLENILSSSDTTSLYEIFLSLKYSFKTSI